MTSEDGAFEALDKLLVFALLPDHVQELGKGLQRERDEALKRVAEVEAWLVAADKLAEAVEALGSREWWLKRDRVEAVRAALAAYRATEKDNDG